MNLKCFNNHSKKVTCNNIGNDIKARMSKKNLPNLLNACFRAFRSCYRSQMGTSRGRVGDSCQQRRLQQLIKIWHINSPKVSPKFTPHFRFHVPNQKCCRTNFEELMFTSVFGSKSTVTAKKNEKKDQIFKDYKNPLS